MLTLHLLWAIPLAALLVVGTGGVPRGAVAPTSWRGAGAPLLRVLRSCRELGDLAVGEGGYVAPTAPLLDVTGAAWLDARTEVADQPRPGWLAVLRVPDGVALQRSDEGLRLVDVPLRPASRLRVTDRL